jgi:TolB protein
MAGNTVTRRTTRGCRAFARAVVCGIAAAAVAAALAGCGSRGTGETAGPSAPAVARSVSPQASADTAVQALPAGQQGSRQQVPWAQVGPGWILAEWSPTLNGSATSLFLIDPAGGRYLLDTFPASPTGSAPTSLLAWSGDGQRALFTNFGASPTVTVLNLRTLATTQFDLTNASPAGFTAPAGLAILVNANVSDSGQTRLERVSLTGQLELSYPASFVPGGPYDGSALYSPDGTELAVGTSVGIELMTNEGQGVRYLNVNDSVSSCGPMRWWTRGELLVSCTPNGKDASQDWLVPTSGATPKALTANPPTPGDLGDGDAWQLPSGTYLQEAGACSYTYVAKLQPDGLTAPVAIPGVPSGESTVILGAQGDRLAIRNVPGSPQTCAHGPGLMWFAPATNSVTPLLGGIVNGGYALSAVLFGES